MKNLVYFTFLLCLSLIFVACDFSPQTKKDYFNQYASFIQEIDQQTEVTSAEQWIEYDKKYQEFSIDFFQRFKKEMLLEEKVKARKLGARYKILRTKSKLKDLF